MSISFRQLGGALLMLLACGPAFAQSSSRLDDLVLRNGFTSLDYAGGDTGLRLQPLGTWRDARGNARFSVWRIRNANPSAKAVRLEAGDFALEFDARPRADTYVRSPVTAGLHRIYVAGSVVDSQSPTMSAWSDGTMVARLSGPNHAPVFLDDAPTLAELKPAYRYAPIVNDPDRELVTLSAPTKPTGFGYDDATRAFVFAAQGSQVGTHELSLRADDGRGGRSDQCVELRLVADFCPIYPIALADAPLASATVGQQFLNTPRGTGAGNFGLLTWAGSPNAPTLAASLARPGDSYTYVNPENAADHQADAGDWLQGSPGNSNSSAVRNAMDALLGSDIVLPTWSATRGQGSNFDYRAARFARVRVSAYSFTGNGRLSFTFQGWASCYNDAPVASDAAFEARRNTPKAFTLIATDPEGDALTFAIVSGPAHGTLGGTAPNLTYAPATGYVGNDRIAFTVSDGQLTSELAFVDITVTVPTNTAPQATPQSVSALEDAPKGIVLAGVDAEGDALAFTVLTPPAHGALSGTAPNLVYAPAANFNGVDAFTFRVADASLQSSPATVSIAVGSVNDAPVANADIARTTRNAAIAITLTGNDVDGDALSFAISTQPTHGTLSGTAPELTYTPAPGYVGSDRFAFVARDGQLESTPAFIDITVDPPRNTAPQAQPQSVSAVEDVPLAIVLVGVDAEGDALTFSIESQPEHGSLAGVAPNLTYIPQSNFHGSDELTFRVSDGILQSGSARVAIAIASVDDAPVGTDQSVQTRRNVPAPIVLAGYDDDGDPLVFVVTMPPAHGALSGTPPDLTYAPTTGYLGADRIGFTASDGSLVSAVAYIDVTVLAPANTAPQADAQALSALEDAPKAIQLTGTDAEDDALAFAVTAPPIHGVLSGVPPNLVYLPAADFHGTDSFAFTASDGTLVSAPATVQLTVAPMNDAPVATSGALHTPEDAAIEFTLEAADVDGDALTYSITAPPAHGAITGTPPTLRYLPAANYHGSDAVSFAISDGELSASANISITVDPVNDAPVADDLRYASIGDPFDISLNGSDVDGDALSFELASQPQHGTLSGVPPALRYASAAGFRGSDAFTYVARDGQSTSAPAVVRIDVSGENRPPEATPLHVSGTEDLPSQLSLSCSDPDGDALAYEVVETASHGGVSGVPPALLYTPASDFAGSDQLRYRCSDGLSNSSVVVVTIDVAAVNDAPVASSFARTVVQGRSIDARLAAFDVENDALTFELQASPTHGSLVQTAPDTYRYTADVYYAGVDQLTYRASDGESWSAPATVTFDVVPAGPNHPPVANAFSATVAEDGDVMLLFSGSDADGDELSAWLDESTPQHGYIYNFNDVEFYYVPDPDYFGPDSFTYRLSDGVERSEPAIVTIAVTPVRDSARALGSNVETDEGRPVDATFELYNPDGLDVTITDYEPRPQHGTVSGSGRTRTYTPDPDFVGQDSFGFYVLDEDGHESDASVSVDVRPENDAPIARPQSISTSEDTSAGIVLRGDDVDGDVLTYSVLQPPVHGVLQGDPPALAYVPANDYNGSDSFEFVVADGMETSAPATIDITVQAVNDAPAALSAIALLDEDTNAALTLSGTDVDGDALSFRVVSGPARGTLSGAGETRTYTPASNYFGGDAVTFVASDGQVDSAVATLALDVRSVNDAPTITTQPQLAVSAGVLWRYDADATDVEGDAVSFALTAAPAGATVSPATGLVEWTAAGSGAQHFELEAFDGNGGRSVQPFDVVVTGDNHAPAITSVPTHSAANGAPYGYQGTATDVDIGDQVSFRLAGGPAGMTASTAGAVSWTASSANPIAIQSPDAMCSVPLPASGSPSGDVADAAEIIVLMDESGSMEGDQDWMRLFLPALHFRLKQFGVGVHAQPNRYGLIGFGRNAGNTVYYRYPDNSYLSADPWAWYTLTRQLIALGEWEDAYEGLVGLTTRYPLREGVARNVILVTDDERSAFRPGSVSTITYAQTLAALRGANIKLNAVLDSVILRCGDGRASMGIDAAGNGYVPDGAGSYSVCSGARDFTTWVGMKEQVTLALATGGAVWDLQYLRDGGANAEALNNLLLDIKAREIAQLPRSERANLSIGAARGLGGDAGIASVSVTVANRGLAVAPANARVRVADAASGAVLGTAALVSTLAPGATEVVVVPLSLPVHAATTLQARIESDDPAAECQLVDNVVDAAVAGITVQDTAGGSSSQWWTITSEERNDAPVLDAIPDQQVAAGQPLAVQLHGSDVDRGDALAYELVSPIGNATIDAHSGEFTFRPSHHHVGRRTFTVRVKDLAGATASASFAVDVLAPVGATSLGITSTPLSRVFIDTTFAYAVHTDAQAGQVLTFGLPLAPAGASIDTTTGAITWPVPFAALGQKPPFIVTVQDQYGNVAAQDFAVEIEQPNVAPVITRPFTRAMQDADRYAGNAQVSDANPFDVLTWTLLKAPPGATINVAASHVAWTAPDPAPATGFVNSEITHDFMCRLPGTRMEELHLRIARTITGAGWSKPAAGRLRDANADGRIDAADPMSLVVADSQGNQVVAIDPATGVTQFAVSPVARVSSDVAPAIADLDGDGQPEILFHGGTTTARTLVALRADGTLAWQAALPPPGNQVFNSSIGVADLVGDSRLEVVLGAAAYDASGGRFATYGARSSGNVDFVDVDGDGRVEVGQGSALYRADGTLIWSYAAGLAHAEMATGNFDADPAPEFVVHAGNYASVNAGSRTTLVDSDGTVRWTNTEGRFSGEPVVADLDGDGALDVYLTGASRALKADGTQLWDPVGGNNFAQALAADLNGDGATELVEFGNGSVVHQRIGITGSVVNVLDASSSPITAATGNTAPLVVDLDGDGSAELVFGGQTRLAILTTAGAPLNTSTTPKPSIVAADLWIGVPTLRLEGELAFVDVVVANRGMRAIATPIAVELRNGSPNRDAGLIATLQTDGLSPDSSRTVTFALGGFDGVPAELYVRIDPANAIVECEERNNAVLASVWRGRVTDTGGLFDEDRWSVGSLRAADTPRIVSVPSTAANELSRWTYAVRLRDPGVSANYRYRLVSGPAGMDVHPNTGVITWVPPLGSVGQQAVSISVVDLRGVDDNQSFTLTVGPSTNHAPVFTSAPVTSSRVGSTYHYDANASDSDNDALLFALVAGPAGMQVDAATGMVTWLPVVADIGSHHVVLRVTDAPGASVTQAFDLTTSAANTVPAFSSLPEHFGKVGREYRYNATATDADGDPLTWTLPQAPAGMTIDANGAIRWTPSAIGVAAVTIRVSDGLGYSEQAWSITVIAANARLVADVSATPRVVAAGAPVTITLGYTGAAGAVARSVSVDGQPVTLDASGQATVNSSVFGRHEVAASVTDGYENATDSDEFFVSDPSDTEAPLVQIHSPGDNDEVTSPRDIVGTVTDAHLASWLLVIRPANSPNLAPTILARGTSSVSAAVVGKFDPTLLINGQYAVILQGTDASGNTTSDSVVLRVTGDMKVGQFSITFEDVSIPVAGIPVRVTRTYDSRQRDESLDFGNGWSVDYQNVRVRESAKPGFSWRTYQPVPGPFGEWCTQSNGQRVITVTLPDGQVESFRAKAVPECTALVPETNVTLQFEPIDGTDSTLAQTDYGLVRVATIAGSGVYNIVDPESPDTPIDPRHYRLTTPEGVIYDLDQFFGVTKITEPNGNTLTYSAAGVRHSTGVGVDFVRDGQGRITKMLLPDGEELRYDYDASGDLRSFADQLLQTSRYEYNKAAFPHYLTDLVDPRGIKVARNEYDDAGRLVATIDADGHRIEYTHDIAGRREQIRDRLGRLQTFTYDDNGRVLSEANALGETTSHTYDGDGNELTRTNDLGHTTTWTYDVRGNRLTERNPLGETTTSTYDTHNNLLTQVDALGHTVIASTYDSRAATLTEMRDALGNVTRFGYDTGVGSNQSGELKSMTDALGHITSYDIDYRGWRYGETDALGHHTTYTHDEMGRVRTETRTRTVGAALMAGDKSGSGAKAVETLVTTTSYDDKGRVTRLENPDGTYSTMEYNAIDKPIRECDRANRCTEHEYNARGEETVTRYPDGTSESKTYDANGNVLTQTDRGGRTTRMVYDEADRLVETIMPDDDANPANNPRTINGFDDAGRLVSTTDPNGNVTRYEYDDAGRRTKVILPATDTAPPAEMLTEYDAAGRRASTTDALSNTTTYVYDDAGRMTDTVFPDGNRAKVEYDALGRKTAEIDPDNRRTEYVYDPLGRLTAVKLAAGTSEETLTTYGYDDLGNRIRQTDAEGRTTRFTHDSAGRELSRTLPLGQAESKAYDSLGRLASQTDFIGKTTNWLYDAVDRVTRIDYPNDIDATFTYTPSGQRETATNGTGTQTSGFDAQDRVVLKRDAAGRVIEYRYDLSGNLVSRTSPNQSIVYTYDARNRMTRVTATVTGQPPRATTYEYDQSGNRTAMVGSDGVRTEYGYDSRYRLINLAKRTAASALLFAASYTVNDTGMRTAIAETDAGGPLRSVVYQYDGLKRLTQEAITHREANQHRISTWSYDRVGNRLTQRVEVGASGQAIVTAYDYDANDRLLAETSGGATTTYAYDANGNTIGRSRPGLATEYAYDDENRLTEMREAGDRTTYGYGPDGLRIAQARIPATGPVHTTEYLRDGQYSYSQVVEEYTRTNGAPAQLEAVLTFGDDLIAQTRFVGTSETTHTVHADGFGSTRFLTDAAGAVKDAWCYDAFGNLLDRTGSTATEHLYRGEQFDTGLNLYYLRARYMSPETGRFLSADSFAGVSGDPVTLHKYLYANSEPVGYSDPSGHMSVGELVAAFTVRATLTRMAVGSVIGGISSKLKGQSFVSGAIPGALGGAISPLIPLELGVAIGAAGVVSAVANGHYAAAFFDALTLGAGFALGTRGFPSFAKFKETYGAAGANRSWHHLVEKTLNRGMFPEERLHHPGNIVNIPNGLHANISAFYSSKQPQITGPGFSRVRDWLRTRPFEEQYAFGLWAMAKLASPSLNSAQANQVGLGISYSWETATVGTYQAISGEDDDD